MLGRDENQIRRSPRLHSEDKIPAGYSGECTPTETYPKEISHSGEQSPTKTYPKEIHTQVSNYQLNIQGNFYQLNIQGSIH